MSFGSRSARRIPIRNEIFTSPPPRRITLSPFPFGRIEINFTEISGNVKSRAISIDVRVEN